MNKSRGVVAGIAFTVLLMAGFLGADLVGHVITDNAYNYELAVPVLVIATVTGVMLFAWNVVTYKGVK
jgi:hypothetical protein